MTKKIAASNLILVDRQISSFCNRNHETATNDLLFFCSGNRDAAANIEQYILIYFVLKFYRGMPSF